MPAVRSKRRAEEEQQKPQNEEDKQVPDAGSVALITGTSRGIGLAWVTEVSEARIAPA